MDDEPRADDLPAAPGEPDQVPAPATAPPRRVPLRVVPRWIQLVALPLGLLALWALARAAGPVLLVFLVSAVIALVLNPLVRLLHRTRLPRGLAVAVVYVGFFAALVGAGILLASPITAQVERFQHDVPNLVGSATHTLADVQRFFDRHGIGIHVQGQGQTALQTLQRTLARSAGNIVSFTGHVLTRLVEGVFAVVLVLVVSIYMLIYAESIGRLARTVIPAGDGSPHDDYPLRVQRAVFGYVRAQLAFSVIMGVTTGLALWIFGLVGIFAAGRSYAIVFGVFVGVMELIPYVGPVLGAIPPVAVALFADPLSALWVALLFLVLQQLEGHVLAPQLFGHSLRINPLLVMFALLFGAEVYGVVGAIIALPLAAVARETVLHLRRHLVLEPWAPHRGRADPLDVTGGGPGDIEPSGGQSAPTAGRCPSCAVAAQPGDAFCRSCGAPLGPRVAAPG